MPPNVHLNRNRVPSLKKVNSSSQGNISIIDGSYDEYMFEVNAKLDLLRRNSSIRDANIKPQQKQEMMDFLYSMGYEYDVALFALKSVKYASMD